MGTRAYAIEVCKVIDPEGRLFGGRILSRDESGSEFSFPSPFPSFTVPSRKASTCQLTLLLPFHRLSRQLAGMTRKSLQRLFPCDTNMVVIIDDRADVWDGSPNLVKVIPCEFPSSPSRSPFSIYR